MLPRMMFNRNLRRHEALNAGKRRHHPVHFTVHWQRFHYVTSVAFEATVAVVQLTLSGRALSGRALSQAFDEGINSYSIGVANGVTSTTLTPTLADPTSSIKVNGPAVSSGSASGSVALNIGGVPAKLGCTWCVPIFPSGARGKQDLVRGSRLQPWDANGRAADVFPHLQSTRNREGIALAFPQVMRPQRLMILHHLELRCVMGGEVIL